MQNRITALFARKKSGILNVYYTAGFPALNDTVRIAQALQKSGADIIEIGIPFSDPVADGPTIQASNKVALDGGMTLKLLLEQLKELRKSVTIPVILMGYINPVMQYGVEKFARDIAAIGIDGLILPDLPLPEYEENYKELFDSLNLCNTFLISPTTSEDRIRKIDAATEGFIYAVSASSITGARGDFSEEQLQYFERLKSLQLRNPFLIGFGISNHKTFAQASQYSAGAIVGSAFINLLTESTDPEGDIETFIKSLKKNSN
jgi:tryptophan synthase alpha chain